MCEPGNDDIRKADAAHLACGGEHEGEERWYAVSATYKAIHVGQLRKRHLWERIIFVIRATNEHTALETAQNIAEEKQHEYVSANDELVRWTLHEVEEVKEILDAEIKCGTEVFWQLYERVDK